MVTNKKAKDTSRQLPVSDVIALLIDLMRLSTDFQICTRVATHRRLASFTHPTKSLAGLDKIVEGLREFACRVEESLAPFSIEDALVEPTAPFDDGDADVLRTARRNKGAAARLCFKACYRKSLTASEAENGRRGALKKKLAKTRRPRGSQPGKRKQKKGEVR